MVMGHPSSQQPMAFFGRYIEVTPHSRLVWTNDEGGEGGAVTTVTFNEKDSATRVVVHELYPSKEALDDAMASGSTIPLAPRSASCKSVPSENRSAHGRPRKSVPACQ